MNNQRLLQFKKITGWSAFVLMVITQWEVRPWPLFAITFFVAGLTWQSVNCYSEFRPFKLIVLTGGVLNFIALAANGGRMPVLGRTEMSRWWQPLTPESRLPPLCDVLWAGFSVGDAVIGVGVLIGVGAWLYRTTRTTRGRSTAVTPGVITGD